MVLIGALAILSILGAFCGADQAKSLFNSIPLMVYWCVLTILLIVGFIKSARQMLGRPGPFMIHAGCLLILAGGMWGSETWHQFQRQFLGIQKIHNGYMIISEGSSTKHIVAENGMQKLCELPFSIKLKDFHLEYYPKDYASIEPKIIKDYLSDVVVIASGKEVANKTIEVNHPLHYGGYHFYQYSYDPEAEDYTVLSVASDSGLYAVYSGYWLLCLGVFWQFWFRHIKRKTVNEVLVQ